MSEFKRNPLEITDNELEQVFGGTNTYCAEVSGCAPMMPKCAGFIRGSNNYIGITLRNTCSQCGYFRQSGHSTECLLKK